MGAIDTPTLNKEYIEPTIQFIKPDDHDDAPVITEFVQGICEDRYLLKDDKGGFETVPHMLWRVATSIAEAEEDPDKRQHYAEEFYHVMRDGKFSPGGRTLAAAGTKIGNLSNCFVISPDDSLMSILETQRQAALVWSRGGGVGFDFSLLRESGANTTKAQGIASGPVSFLKAYNATADTIRQGGARRAACMGELSVHHPDVEKFIVAKEVEGDLSCFNISVAMTDEFMDALKRGDNYNRYTYKGDVHSTVSAQDTWDLICKFAWQTADPGLYFLDTANRCDFAEVNDLRATNPCGEQPLNQYESCNLGSIRLDQFVEDFAWEREADGWTMPKGPADQVARQLWDTCIDKEELRRTIVVAVRFLDDVITINKFPLPEIAEITQRHRKIGLGVMGWADMLLKLGVDYRSEVASALARKVMTFINNVSVAYSEELVKGGRSSVQERLAKVGHRLTESKHIKPRRNMWTTSIAPTGSISMVAGCCTWSTEPVFAWQQKRKLQTLTPEGQPHIITVIMPNNVYRAFRDAHGEEAELPEYFVTAHEVTPEQHVRMMAAFQEHCHSAVSKTINLPTNATIEEVSEVFHLAYALGCKGITVYRNECREEQVYYTEDSLKVKEEEHHHIAKYARPVEVFGKTVKMGTDLGSAYITINNDETGNPVEVFVRVGKQGSKENAAAEAVGRLISIGLQSGVEATEIVDQLAGITSTPMWSNGIQIKSVWDAVSRVLDNDYNGNARELQGDMSIMVEESITAERVPVEEEPHVRCKECGE